MALTPRQQECLNLMLAGHTQASCARAMKAHKSTVSRWCDRPEFIIALADAQASRRRSLNAVMEAALPRALARLIQLATKPNVPSAVQYKACVKLLEQGGVFDPEPAEGTTEAPRRRIEALERLSRVFEHPISAAPAPLTLIPKKGEG